MKDEEESGEDLPVELPEALQREYEPGTVGGMLQDMFQMLYLLHPDHRIPHEMKVVAHHEADDLFVDTAWVADGMRPFETAVRHADYHDNMMVIVEAYDTREEAEAGHARWLKAMSEEPLPEELVDCMNARVARHLDAAHYVFPRRKKGEPP